MSLPRYPEYKDSDVDWLGEVPGHWAIAPLYSVANNREEPNIGMLEDNLLSLSYGRIVQKDISSNDGLLPQSFETYQIVHPGDIVFRLTDLQNDKRSLRTAIVEETGIITSAYTAAKPVCIEPEYLNHLLRAYDVQKVFYSMGGGLRQSLKFSDLKRLPTLLPSYEEQQTISAFLDRETGKIDALIAEQRRLVELLAEKRQAVISHAVTKGLNPNAPTKDSGIEWLGDVPGHWDILSLKRICELLKDGTHLPPPRVSEGIPLLSVRNIQNGIFDLRDDDSLISLENYQELCKAFVPQTHDVLLAIVGATLGKVALVPLEIGLFHIQRSVAIFRPTAEMQAQYLYYLFQSNEFQQLLWEHVGYSAQPGIYLGTLAEFRIPLPPLEEQQTISTFLNTETAKFDALTLEANRAIALLQERRSALISAAVTGKIDVRQHAVEAFRGQGQGGATAQLLADRKADTAREA